jgi:hypothetical protein
MQDHNDESNSPLMDSLLAHIFGDNYTELLPAQAKEEHQTEPEPTQLADEEEEEHEDWLQAMEPVYIYAAERGFLLLSDEIKAKHNVIKRNITLDADDPCFGGRYGRETISNKVLKNAPVSFEEFGWI